MRQAKIDHQTMLNLFEANQDVLVTKGPMLSRRHGAGVFMGFQEDILHLKDEDGIAMDYIESTISGITKLYYIPFKQLLSEVKPKSMSEDDFLWLKDQSKRLLVPYQVMVLCECRPNHWAMIKVDTF